MRNRKIRILILITFLVALVLSIGGYAVNMVRNAKDDPPIEQVKPPELDNPIIDPGVNTIDWPEIDDAYLSGSITNYNGDVDMDEFEYLFNKEFSTQDLGIDNLSVDKTFDYDESTDTIKVDVNCGYTSSNQTPLRNSNHTYTYKVIENNIV